MARILVVEDEPDLRMVFRLSFELLGHDVLEAATGEEGVRRVRSDHPDFVLLDLRLPGIDGFEVVRRLGDDHPPVALMSAHGDPLTVRRQALAEGCVAFLPKPFVPDEVDRLVAEHVPEAAT